MQSLMSGSGQCLLLILILAMLILAAYILNPTFTYSYYLDLFIPQDCAQCLTRS